jgi:hypothetical protein
MNNTTRLCHLSRRATSRIHPGAPVTVSATGKRLGWPVPGSARTPQRSRAHATILSRRPPGHPDQLRKAKITGQKYTGSENETVTMTG